MLFRPISNINKILWLIMLALLSATAASAQTCPIKLDQLPDSVELRGFRLGMTYDQVKARIPQVQFGRPDQIGVVKTTINPFFDPRIDKAGLADVRTISLDFLDGRLVTLWIGLEGTFKWQSLDEFVAGMSKSLNLPAAWSTKRGGRQLSCEGFSVFASLIAGGPGIRLTDEAAQEIIATRREEAAQAAEALVIADQRTKLYYPAGCAALEGIPEPNWIRFKDKDEAEKAGFKLAKDCQ
jgi:hypothetical protein